MARTEGCEYEETIYLDERIKATFLDNGHLPGAAMILVQISYYGEETLNLLFTGDYKAKSLWREIKDVPEWVKALPKDVVIESTYGYMESSEVEYHYEEDIPQIIARGKSILQMTFAQERAQTFLYEIVEVFLVIFRFMLMVLLHNSSRSLCRSIQTLTLCRKMLHLLTNIIGLRLQWDMSRKLF